MIVASAPQSHAEHVCAALEAGKAVFSEVPAAHTLADAQQIVDTVTRTGGFYMLGENCNYYGFIREWRRMMDEGILGRPIHAEGEYVHDIRGITWVDEDGKCYNPADPACPATARPSWRAGYNPIQYITHSLGPLLWLLDDRCTSVSCLSSGALTQPENLAPDAQIALLETAKGVPVRQSCIFSAPKEPGGQWYNLYTTRGYVEWKRAPWDSGKLFLADSGMTELQRAEWPNAVETPFGSSGHGGIDGGVVWEFTEAFRAGKPSPIDVHVAMDYTLPGIYALLSAERGGERLRIPDTRTERIIA
jgi:predicted dehydrogenase